MSKRTLALYILYIMIFIIGFATSWYVINLFLFKTSSVVIVPDIKGKTIVDAWETLQKKGLELSIDTFIYTNTLPRYTIVSQKPAPGKKTRKGRRVYVKVSLGRKTYPPPDLVGLKLKDVQRILQGSPFSIKRIAKTYSVYEKNTVIAQYPPPGEETEERFISLLISKGHRAKFLTPDFTNKKLNFVVKSIKRKIPVIEIVRSTHYNGLPDIVKDQYPMPGFPMEDRIILYLPESTEGLRVISLYLQPGLLRKFVEVILRFDNINLKVYKKVFSGGKRVFIIFPEHKEETLEVLINGKKPEKNWKIISGSFYSIR